VLTFCNASSTPIGRAIDPGVHRFPAILPTLRSRARETCTNNERWNANVPGDFYSRLQFASQVRWLAAAVLIFAYAPPRAEATANPTNEATCPDDFTTYEQ